MLNSNFVIWRSAVVPGACILGEFEGVEKSFQLRKGISRADSFPANATFTMNPEFPNDTLLADNLFNTNLFIVASIKVKNFLEGQKILQMEYLPVKIVDHKGRVASSEYFIIHPIDPVECIDLKSSDVDWGIIDKTLIDHARRLVLDETKVPPDRQIFRPKPYYRIILVRRDLAKLIDDQGFSGIRWDEITTP
jgi:hypothetical protein